MYLANDYQKQVVGPGQLHMVWIAGEGDSLAVPP